MKKFSNFIGSKKKCDRNGKLSANETVKLLVKQIIRVDENKNEKKKTQHSASAIAIKSIFMANGAQSIHEIHNLTVDSECFEIQRT